MPEDTDTCACGHVADEHGHNPSYPGSSACLLCGCVAFECTEDHDGAKVESAIVKLYGFFSTEDHDESGRACPRRKTER